MPDKPSAIPKNKLDLYNKLITGHPEIERKGVKMLYTSLNGHMFSYLSQDGTMGLRLPKEEREAFLDKHKTTLFEQYGAVMKEYVTVPDDLFKKPELISDYLNLSLKYIKSLKPK